MSTTLAHLLAWSERLPDHSGEEANILRAIISTREASLRETIFNLIYEISQREGWEAYRFEVCARWAQTIPVAHLESISDYLRFRLEGRLDRGAADLLASAVAEPPPLPVADAAPVAAPESAVVTAPVTLPMPQEIDVAAAEQRLAPPPGVMQLALRLDRLEAHVAPAPVVTCGLQGIRPMQMVALMSKARVAEISQRRIDGLQLMYRHL